MEIVYEVKLDYRLEDDGKLAKAVILVKDTTITGAEVRANKYLEEESYHDFEITQITKKKFDGIVMDDPNEDEDHGDYLG